MRKLPIEVRFGLRGNRENHKEPTPVQLYHKIKSRGKTVVYMCAENHNGHPDPEVLKILDGRLILRNAPQGRVHIRSDGKLMWIETERGIGADEASIARHIP